MTRITISDIRDNLGVTETYDIVNAIRNSASTQFQNYVPLANAENVAEVGQGINISSVVQNEFIVSLVERIGLVLMRKTTLQNGLKKFKKGQLPLGRTIQEIFVDITEEHAYDPDIAETNVFKRVIPNVDVLFHERNRQGFYKQTIQDDSLASAFTSWNQVGDFINGIIGALYNSDESDEFEYMKLIIDNYYSKGLFKVIKVDKPNTQTASKQFVKALRATARKLSLSNGSRDYNALAVKTRSEIDNLHIIMTADLEAEIDVDVLAAAFNMNKSDFMGNVTVIDSFASPNLEAVMIDADYYMVYDTLFKMTTQYNAEGLYWNYFLHHWQVLSASQFANAVAFASGEVAPVTSVILDPKISSLKRGASMKFTSYVRQTDDVKYAPVYTLDGSYAVGTTIDSTKGILKVSADEPKDEIKVKSTVTYTKPAVGEDEEETISVVGESIVTLV